METTRDQRLDVPQGDPSIAINKAFEALTAILEKLGADRKGIKVRVELVYSSPELPDKPATLHAHMEVDTDIELSHVAAAEPARVEEVASPVTNASSVDALPLPTILRGRPVYPSSYLSQFPILQEEVQPALEFFKGHRIKDNSAYKGVEDALATSFGSYIPSHVLTGILEEGHVAAGLSESTKYPISNVIRCLLKNKLKNSPYTIESVQIAYEKPDPITGRRFYTAYRMIKKPGVDVKAPDPDEGKLDEKPSEERKKPSKIYELEELSQFPLIEEEVQPALDWFEGHRHRHSDYRIFEYLFSASFGKYILRHSLERDVAKQRKRSERPSDLKLVTLNRLLSVFKSAKLKDSPYMLEKVAVYCEDGQYIDGERRYDHAYRMVKKPLKEDAKSKRAKLPDREELANLPVLEEHVGPATRLIEERFLLNVGSSKGVSRTVFLFLASNVGRYFATNNSDWLSFVSERAKEGSVNPVSIQATFASGSGMRLKGFLPEIGLRLDKRKCKGRGHNISCNVFGIVPIGNES